MGKVARAVAIALWASAVHCGGTGEGDAESDLTVPASPFWKNTVEFPVDRFMVNDTQTRWVKFSIFASDPAKVYFQDSNKYTFHYEFAKNHLPPFRRMTAPQFESATLKKEGQKLVTGALLLPPRSDVGEVGIQLIRQDAYSKEEVKKYFDKVKAAVRPARGTKVPQAFYMPTFEQSRAAEANKAWLMANKIPISSPSRWLSGDACYSSGWAFGRVVRIAPDDIDRAYREGRLKEEDILLTEGVPAEVPALSGILSLAPSSPNSHVAILATSLQIPFVYPATEDKRARFASLVGKEILLRASDPTAAGECQAESFEISGELDASTRGELAALRRPKPLTIAAKRRLGALTKPASSLTPRDVVYFGGKASHYGTILRSVEGHAPVGLGISFDLWDAFLEQTMPSGKTLKEEVDERLSDVTYPPNPGELFDRLKEIRDLVENAPFPERERQRLLSDFGGFDPKKKLRLRSSTNVEDSDQFSGAGLYESHSGCLADDLDADEEGPSACDVDQPKERGVLRAIKKVFASFYNDNAVFERLKHAVREEQAGMALLAHVSSPDADELANGVAKVRVRSWGMDMELVTQLGAESVTNPSGSDTPEVMRTQPYGEDVGVIFVRGSSLVPMGRRVLGSEAEYKELTRLIEKVSSAFLSDKGIRVGDEERFLDLEYKWVKPRSFVIKQVRTFPTPGRTPSIEPILLNHPTRFCTEQGEVGTVLANHRQKMQLLAEVRNTDLSTTGRAKTLYTQATIERVEGGRVVTQSGPLASRPNFNTKVSVDPNSNLNAVSTSSWDGEGATLAIETAFPTLVAPADLPVKVLSDLWLSFRASFAAPKPEFGGLAGDAQTREDFASLEPCVDEGDIASRVQTTEAHGPRGLVVKTQYRYRRARSPYEKTASLGGWVGTEIRGLTRTPIKLTGWYAQSFRPGHHNFTEDFAFEPALDPGVSEATLRALDQKDIQVLVMVNASAASRQADFWIVRKSTGRLERLE